MYAFMLALSFCAIIVAREATSMISMNTKGSDHVQHYEAANSAAGESVKGIRKKYKVSKAAICKKYKQWKANGF